MPAPLVALAATAGLGLVKDLAAKALGPQQTAQQAKARTTATEFESMFLEQSLNRLTASTGTEGPLGDNGVGGDVYRSMLVKEYAGQITRSGGVGIASQVYSQMMRLQEAGQVGGGQHAAG